MRTQTNDRYIYVIFDGEDWGNGNAYFCLEHFKALPKDMRMYVAISKTWRLKNCSRVRDIFEALNRERNDITDGYNDSGGWIEDTFGEKSDTD